MNSGVFLMAQTSVTAPKNEQRQLDSTHWSGKRLATLLRRFTPLLMIGLLLGMWQLVVTLEIYPSFIIPAPSAVFDEFVDVLLDGSLLVHTRVTFIEMSLGLLIGGSLGVIFGYLIAKNRILEDALSPIIVALQSTPIVAYAPLLIIWFGSGTTSKIITASLIVFFPMLMNTVVGLRNVPKNLQDLMRSLNATPWQLFTRLEIPAALPVLLTGLKTSATLAVIGAVVGEFVSASEGLGFLVTIARNQFNTPLVFVAVFTMTAMALSLYLSISLLERYLLRWQYRSNL